MNSRSMIELSGRIGPRLPSDDAGTQGREKACAHGVRDEAGAVLILALVFLVAVSLVVTALVTWAGNDLKNVAHFKAGRTYEYSADGATEVAIQSARYSYTAPTADPTNPPACPDTGPTVTIDGVAIDVWCSTVWVPSSFKTRTVTFSACLASVTASACAASPYLQAVVTFDDYSSLRYLANSAPCTSTCGAGMTLSRWVVK
jgi:hypothetical protein